MAKKAAVRTDHAAAPAIMPPTANFWRPSISRNTDVPYPVVVMVWTLKYMAFHQDGLVALASTVQLWQSDSV